MYAFCINQKYVKWLKNQTRRTLRHFLYQNMPFSLVCSDERTSSYIKLKYIQSEVVHDITSRDSRVEKLRLAKSHNAGNHCTGVYKSAFFNVLGTNTFGK